MTTRTTGARTALLLAVLTTFSGVLGAQAAHPSTAAAAPSDPTASPGPPAVSATAAPSAKPSPTPQDEKPAKDAPAAEQAGATSPTATDDVALTPFRTAVTLAGVTNDQPGDPTVPLRPTLATFTVADLQQAPAGSTLSTDQRTLTAKGQGTWTFAADGSVGFAPAVGYAGTPLPVTYVVPDADGVTATATLRVTVRPGPVGKPDTATTPQNQGISVRELRNDVAGYNANGTQGSIYGSRTYFAPTGQPAGATVSNTDHYSFLTVPGEGRYTAHRDEDGIGFAPERTFFGVASPVTYVASDIVRTTAGTSVRNAYASTVTITVTRTQPVAVDDAATTAFDQPVVVNVLRNDSAGDQTAPLSPSSVQLRVLPGLPVGSALLERGTLLRLPGTGDFTVGSDGLVTFFPVRGFVGAVPAVGYSVADANGTIATATLRVTVGGPLLVTATAGATTIDRIGQRVAYAFAVRNTSALSLSDLIVQAPGAELSALVCAPIAQGGTLAAGATTTCRASRTTTLADLRQTAVADTVSVSAQLAGGQAVAGGASVAVKVAVAPPTATDQHKWAIAHGKTVVFPAALMATPAVAGGPPIDVSRTFFPDVPYHHGKLDSDGGSWTVEPDGSVQLDPVQDGPRETSLRYRVFDVLGNSTTATLTLTLREAATADDLDVSTLQGQRLTFDPLRADQPGENLDGSRATFVRSSVRIARDPGSFGAGTITPGGKSFAVPWVGTFAVGADGRVTFDPAPQYSTSTWFDLQYTAEDSAGSQIRGNVRVHVAVVSPKTRHETLATTYGHPVTFKAASDDTAGNPAVPIDRAATVLTPPFELYRAPAWSDDESRTLTDRAGTWQVEGDGSVRFSPALGYSGTDEIGYAAIDSNGTRSRAALSVTVRPGPLARADRATTARGTRLTLDPLANDVPSRRTDGTAATFDASSLRFATAGQPAGSTVSAQRTTLTVPGQGTWTVSTGRIVLVPAPGFAGGAAPVSYQVTDTAGGVATGTVTATITSDVPTANDDVLSTPFGTAVVVDASRDDSPGSAALDLGSTVFAADGQPAGSTRSSDGHALALPGQGTWVLAGDGTATFTPVATFVGTSSPAAYVVADRIGRTARATVRAQVRPGPQARPDTTVADGAQRLGVGLAVLLNDVPGRNADGTLGHTDQSSLRLARTGQPPGWTVTADGLQASNATGLSVHLEYAVGAVQVLAALGASGSTGHLVYTVDDLTTTATGATVRHPLTSYVEVTFPASHPTATADHAATTSPQSVVLPAAQNDVPTGPVIFPIDLASVTFPTAQLGRLPKGSTIDNTGFEPTLTVAGEGTWTANDIPYGNSEVGSVRFVPVTGFVGETSEVDYRITDSIGSGSVATLSVTVRPGYVARPDVVRTSQNVPVTFDILANDDPGQNADGSRAAPSGSVRVLGADGNPAGTPPSDTGIVRYVSGEGVYRVNYVGGQVTFTPVPGFTGAATPVRFAVGPFDATSALQVTVDPVTPVARDDAAITDSGVPVVVPVLANDNPGVSAVPLVGSTLRLRLAAGLPAGSTLSGDAKRLTIPGRGVFLAAGDGEITFVPLDGAAGTVPTVGYQIADANGTTARATLDVIVVG